MNAHTIFITGGHLTPALAVIECIKAEYPDWKIFFIGRDNPFDSTTIPSEERDVTKLLQIDFIPINSVRFNSISILYPKNILRFITSILYAIKIIKSYKPDVIMTFGSYIAVPIALAGYINRIPVITHEQTQLLGLANRIISIFAKKICLTYTNTKYASGDRILVTGLPIRKSIYNPPENFSFQIPKNKQIIYITGGTTGSASINTIIYSIISKLVCSYVIIHQTGRLGINEAKIIRRKLRGDKRINYFISPYVNNLDHSWLLHHASLLIGRSGANTAQEIICTGIPSILIPLPWSRDNEQLLNAEKVVKETQSMILNQSDLNSETLLQAISLMIQTKKRIVKNNELQKSSAHNIVLCIKNALK
jgi:UDP-N-acetylglucosamine--N-acetylmuramyl-(pentapeptide) pyrophosphoryl-undecaprenol N-acetylglucosamine transferase